LINQYPDFKYSVGELKKYITGASGFFSIMLKNGDIISHQPEDASGFRAWLDKNGVIDVQSETRWYVLGS
jgi:hypothetical protein